MALERSLRWRLILGRASEQSLCSGDGPGEQAEALDGALDFLYGREGEGADEQQMDKSGRGDTHPMTVPEWINKVHSLFPKEAIERLERDALHRYKLHEVVTNAEALKAAEPNLSLVEAILHSKKHMDPKVLEMAREIVRKVAEQLKRQLIEQLEHRYGGTPWKTRKSRYRTARNLDAIKTIRRNLRNWSAEHKRILIDDPQFFARLKRSHSRYQVILLVDESGSMLRNIIHSAVVAACLWEWPAVKTHLVIWDTEVVDLTSHAEDPVEILLRVQLGGGNDAAKALRYAQTLIEAPQRAIVVLITDFYEGGGADAMVREVAGLVEAGVQVFGVAALDDQVRGAFDRRVAQQVAEAGAHVAATTPLELAGWLLERVRR